MRRVSVRINGTVQGVGFRPFLHRLAGMYGLTGWARNTGAGVELEWQGSGAEVSAALAALQTADRLPLMAQVLSLNTTELAPQPVQEQQFLILPSKIGGQETLIAPDSAPCPDCLRELRSPKDRRYRYPFLNCTNCGPRFTIVKGVPYDRARTTMDKFALCERCGKEYETLTDRRYHAQPTCCPTCGPRLWFGDAAGTEQPGEAFALAQALLNEGKILAVKGLGGFHLACRTDMPGAVARLRQRKHRPARPLAVMCKNLAAARQICSISPEEAALLESPRRPIVLLDKRDPAAFAELSATQRLGVLLPYTPVHELLFEGADFTALVMTSANRSDLPVETTNEDAVAHLAGIADGFLLHDRDIEARCDDSLVQWAAGQVCLFRRSRGYAPQPVAVEFSADGLLALGAEQKASFALGKGKNAFYSQHIGDLKNAETLAHYEEQISRYQALFGKAPHTLVCDLHPDFLSTRYAEQRAAAENLRLLRVQHHHAHMAACMADHRLTGECIGIVWDGTGYGTDGTTWGSEFLVGSAAAVQRKAALLPLPLIGGDTAVKEIDRLALALCWQAGILGDAALGSIPAGKRLLFTKLLKKDLNCPKSSGMGRLFDGVYTLLTGEPFAAYEGQRAAELEDMASRAAAEVGVYPLVNLPADASGVCFGDVRVLIRALLEDKLNGTAPKILAMRFHNSLVAWAVKTCLALRQETGLGRVVLSGGVFFNRILAEKLVEALRAEGFTVFLPERVSPGDEGVALGQLAVAAALGCG